MSSDQQLAVSLGITTYRRISERDFARSLYGVLAENSHLLIPDRLGDWARHPRQVRNADDFAELWAAPISWHVNETVEAGRLNRLLVALRLKRRRLGPLQFDAYLPPEWSRSRAPKGYGKATIRRPDDGYGDNTVVMSHAYHPDIDWFRFFRTIVELTTPSCAMMQLNVFDGNFSDTNPPSLPVGERTFTGRVDRWRLKERREYRRLPYLAWANYFGPEFEGVLKQTELAAQAAHAEQFAAGLLVTVTPSITDSTEHRNEYQAALDRLQARFPIEVFKPETRDATG